MSQQTLAAWHRFTITMTALAVVGIGLTQIAPAQQQLRQPQAASLVGQTPSAPAPPSDFGRFLVVPAAAPPSTITTYTEAFVVDTKLGRVWRMKSNGISPEYAGTVGQ